MNTVDHTKNIIELRNVCFSYGDDFIIKDVNLAVHQGDYLGIVGPNGGGKSTLLKLMLGILTPTEGKVFLYGTEITKFHDFAKIGYVSQQVTHIDPNFPMTVEEVVMMGRFPKLGLFRFPTEADRKKVREALEEVEMGHFRNRRVGDLSGGQQQRVFIARALAGEPDVIILDEPTTGVDIKTQKQFYTLLQTVNTKLHLTLVLVSHELDIVAHEATEIAYINRTLVYHGIPKTFMKSEYFEKLTGKGVHTDAF